MQVESIKPITTTQPHTSTQYNPYVTLILPVYQEEANIEQCVRDSVAALQSSDHSFEILAVDDGSTDGSFDILMALQKNFPQLLRVARHMSNKGFGAALRTGIRMARGEIVVCMDSDGQHNPQDIMLLLSYIPPYDMVVGSRTAKYQGAWYRNFANRFYNFFASWLTNTKILDLTSGFRAIRRAAILHFLHLYPPGFSASTTATLALLKAGYNVRFVPVQVLPRTKGKSHINPLRDGSQFVMIILRMIMLYDPLRIFVPVAAGIFALGAIAMVLGIWAAQRLVVPGSSVVLFISAVLALLLGLVSSQVSATNIHYFGDETVSVFENQIDTKADG